MCPWAQLREVLDCHFLSSLPASWLHFLSEDFTTYGLVQALLENWLNSVSEVSWPSWGGTFWGLLTGMVAELALALSGWRHRFPTSILSAMLCCPFPHFTLGGPLACLEGILYSMS